MSNDKRDKYSPRLVNISGSTWVDPGTVRQIIMFNGVPAKRDLKGSETEAGIPARVKMTLDEQVLTFTYKSDNAASEQANRMADIINGVSDDPDDPAEDDIPDPQIDGKIVALRSVAS